MWLLLLWTLETGTYVFVETTSLLVNGSMSMSKRKAGGIPIYTVKGFCGMLHQNILLSCGFLPVATEECAQPRPTESFYREFDDKSWQGEALMIFRLV